MERYFLFGHKNRNWKILWSFSFYNFILSALKSVHFHTSYSNCPDGNKLVDAKKPEFFFLSILSFFLSFFRSFFLSFFFLSFFLTFFLADLISLQQWPQPMNLNGVKSNGQSGGNFFLSDLNKAFGDR